MYSGGVVAGAGAPKPPPPPPAPTTVAATERPAASRRKPRTDPPETIPISPALLAWAEGLGYTRAIVDDEMDRCLTWHRREGMVSADWAASLRGWLKNEVSYSRRDGRALGDHAGPARVSGGQGDGPASRDPGRAGAVRKTGYTGSRNAPNTAGFEETLKHNKRY